jgi:hypothetical protein
MTLRFPPEVEAKLQERARQTGATVEQLVESAVQEMLERQPMQDPDELSSEEWVKRWKAWVQSMREHVSRTVPPGVVADDSRESIYEGRGE